MTNSNKSIRKIDEQIQSLMDVENSFLNNNYKKNNRQIENDYLKTDTKEMQCIDYLETIEKSTDESTMKIDTLDSKIAFNENEFKKNKNDISIQEHREEVFNITNLIMIIIIVILLFVIIFLIL